MKYILRKDDIENMPGENKTHFLNKNAKRNNKSLGDETGLKNLGFHIIEILPGHESTEYHVHYSEDECVYILSGEGIVIIDNKDYPVSEGDFIGYPANGLPHGMKNISDEPLRCIVAGQRLSNEVADYPRLNKRLYVHGNIAEVVDKGDLSEANISKKN